MGKHIVSFSGGKDSTAMLFMMLERKIQIDEIIFCDTGMEFPDMYKHIEKFQKFIGRKITIVSIRKSYDYWMFEHEKSKGKRKGQCGYGWATMRNRWCTTLKKQAINKYLKEKYSNEKIIEYHGIAYDEPQRIGKNNDGRIIKYPLYNWKITEKEALKYCYDLGFDWNGLYEQFKRVSCWCCPLKSLPELKALYKHHKDLWKELKRMDNKALNKFRLDYTLDELETKFKKEIWIEEHQINMFSLMI